MALAAPHYRVEPGLILGMRKQGTAPHNVDGFGVMYVQDGEVKIHRTMDKDIKVIADTWEDLNNQAIEAHSAIAVHFRKQTLGAITLENVHPFPVTLKSQGAKHDIWMMHNGTMEGIQHDYNRSDSYNFATYFLGPLLAKHPNLYTSQPFWFFLSGLTHLNKYIFIRDDGKTQVVNSRLGTYISPDYLWGSKKDKLGIVVVEDELDTTPLALPPPQLNMQNIGAEDDDWEDMISPEQGIWKRMASGFKHFNIRTA